MRRLGIYSSIGLGSTHFADAYQAHAVRMLRPELKELRLTSEATPATKLLQSLKPPAVEFIKPSQQFVWTGEGYRDALAGLSDEALRSFDEILLFDASFFGPIFPAREIFAKMAKVKCDYWSATYLDIAKDRRFENSTKDGLIPHWNFMILRRPVFEAEGFRAFWKSVVDAPDYWTAFQNQEVAFGKFLHEKGFNGATFVDKSQLKTSDPRIYESHKLVEQRCPTVERALFGLSPVTQDMQALQTRRTLELIKSSSDYDTGMIWHALLRTQQLRDIQTNLDLVSVLPNVRAAKAKARWSFGRVAVFAHIYYAEMVDEFLKRVDNIPAPFDFFITTATKESQALIQKRMKGFKGGKIEVRVVAFNRGRDMSSLFITFRDIILSGKYELALRLHSKKTPQMSPHISETFMDHLVENLVPSREFVANLFDIIEADPNIGLVIPPVIHIGFGTLGHSWFNNRASFTKVAKTMGIDVPFDDFTPVAPYGTMYWFRCAALKPLFAYPWKWADYNPEPHHVDGGLAHIQERLIAYVAQNEGYRTETVLSTALAGRYYAKLEYKHQLLASTYPHATISKQFEVAKEDKIRREQSGEKASLAKRVKRFDKNFRSRYPRIWSLSRPLARIIWPVLSKFNPPQL